MVDIKIFILTEYQCIHQAVKNYRMLPLPVPVPKPNLFLLSPDTAILLNLDFHAGVRITRNSQSTRDDDGLIEDSLA